MALGGGSCREVMTCLTILFLRLMTVLSCFAHVYRLYVVVGSGVLSYEALILTWTLVCVCVCIFIDALMCLCKLESMLL